MERLGNRGEREESKERCLGEDGRKSDVKDLGMRKKKYRSVGERW